MRLLYTSIRRLIYLALGAINKIIPYYRTNVFILCYHRISNDGWDFSVNLKEFKKQINFLASKYQFITLSDIHDYFKDEKVITRPSVVINFDDGYKDILHVKSFLKSHGIKPTVFLIADRQNANRQELETNKEFLSKKDILCLVRTGWEIGSHTATHPNMNNLNDIQIKHEIIESKNILEKELNLPIRYLAFPKGRYSQQILKAVKKAGYDLALTMDDGQINRKTDLYRIPRIGVDGTHSLAEFKTLFLPLNIKVRGLIKSFNYGQ